MNYKTEDFIEYALKEFPTDTRQIFSEKLLIDILKEPLDCGKVTLINKMFDEGNRLVYNFEYNEGYIIYIPKDDFDNWYIKNKRNKKIIELGL